MPCFKRTNCVDIRSSVETPKAKRKYLYRCWSNKVNPRMCGFHVLKLLRHTVNGGLSIYLIGSLSGQPEVTWIDNITS